MKSLQFRSIAPKAPAPAVVPPSPALLSCQQQPPEASTAAAAAAAKSIIVPAQNYALMQVAGQEGTFSLVALPPAVNPQTTTPPQHQQQAQPIQKNLKLPIPRYQPMRSKGTPEKARSAPPAVVVKAKSPTKVAVTTRARSLAAAATRRRPPEAKEGREMKVEPPEQVMLVDPSAGEVPVAVAPLLPDSAVVYPERGASAVDGSPAPRGLLPNPHYSSAAAIRNSPATAAQEEAKAAPGSITVLSPAIFSKAVQIIPSPPKGKLPILPYSKMKGTLVPAARLPPASPSEPSSETADALRGGRPPPPSQPRAKAAPPPPPSLGALQKPPAKKRGRKRKTPEDILAFEARKKRSLSFFRRRVPEKPPAAASTAGATPRSEQREVDISKKYRSIRPKPVLLMDTLPRLVGLPALAPAADGAVPPLPPPPLHHFRAGPQRAYPVTGGLGTGVGGGGGGAGRAGSHRCSVCGRCFRFKHHLQSHVNSHANGRPHACPVCRKAYAHSGSLSTHMKLRHGEGRPRPWRRTLRCEFCDKAFGYVGVYFGHLREVHRVVLTVEPSISQHEDRGPADGLSPDSSDEHGQEEREDPVELQIKCGRCQATTPTFADMKLHLLYVHSEEVRAGPRDGAARGGREAEDELVKHAAHYWRQLNERRNPVKCGSCDEEFFSFSKLKRHILSQHPGEPDDGESGESAGEAAGGAGGGRRLRQGAGPLWAGAGYNCVLCSQVLDSRDEVMDHWRGRHHCEQPGVLWEALSSCSAQGEAEMETESDTPAHSPSH